MFKVHVHIIILLVLLIGVNAGQAQVQVWNQSIEESRLNVRGDDAVVVAQIRVKLPENGQVLMHFDGQCMADYGDRIILAASNTTTWGINDGHVQIEAANSDVNRGNFSHTRMYPVKSGSHTFYALAQCSAVEADGSGIISLFGALVVKYFPDTGTNKVWSARIDTSHFNARGKPVILAEQLIKPPSTGNVLVRFDGFGFSDVGDRIVLAASDTTRWYGNEGSVNIEAVDADINTMSFSHSRMYLFNPKNPSFYAIAENYVELSGNGIATVYGNLSVEFFPGSSDFTRVQHQGIAESRINVRDSVVTLASLMVATKRSGKVVVHFDGKCISDVGDRIVLAASHFKGWENNSGSVAVEAVNKDQDTQTFSHTRVYEIRPGLHDFFAVAQNYVEKEGNGIASIYGNFTVEFFADIAVGLEDQSKLPNDFCLEQNYPNPFNPATTIPYSLKKNSFVSLKIFNVLGQEIRTLVETQQPAGLYQAHWDGADNNYIRVESGVYFYQLKTGAFSESRKMLLVK